MELKDKIEICKVVAQAIMVDGMLTDAERDALDRLMDRYGLDAEQRKDVKRRNIEDDPAQMIEDMEAVDSKNELIVELVMALAADGALAPSERGLLDSVARALSLTDEDVEPLIKAALA
ncbi:MAG: TerB family tellurite resistance protein [Deltaproteobacteria bacterium]|nr:TerB family tellurite resistance protein [Deltaproteobacteria bacterium]